MIKSTLVIEGGNLVWRNKKDQFHRDNDLPAVIKPNGYKAWYINGKVHRDNDLPAVIKPNGYKAWYINGKEHRGGDKPAIIYLNGYKEWWVNGHLIKTRYD